MNYTFTAPTKHPFAELRHGMDWRAELSQGETITAQTVEAPPGLTIENVTQAEGVVSWTVKGGEAGQDYVVTVKITTTGPEKDARSLLYRVRDR